MNDGELLNRITINPKIMVGKPIIRGTRLTVEYLMNLLAHGATIDEILNEYKSITRQDVQACILYATKTLETTSFLPLITESA